VKLPAGLDGELPEQKKYNWRERVPKVMNHLIITM